ncbi:trehalase family glycosidase, partial [Pseudomonas sp. SIMBA_065]
LWDSTAGVFRDYDWRRERFGAFTVASVVPLFVGLATPHQAHLQSISLRHLLLSNGGLLTSMVESGEQWDRPNGWAPMQWMAVVG